MRTDVLFRLHYQWCVAVLMLLVVGASPASGAANEKTAASAQSVYEAKCALCHGATGKGDGWQTKLAFWMKTPNLADARYMQTRSDDVLFQVMKAGGPTGMPAFRLEMTEPQMKELVTYIRNFTKTPGPQKPASAAR